MLDRISLIRNVGQFDSVSDGAHLPLSRLTLVYAENGRGKTTLSAILRSLGSGDPVPIAERKRLSSTQPPHVVVKPLTGAPMHFQAGTWTQTFSNLAVFDDVFVDQNVYSGLSVDPIHRQNLHEFIIGAQGVTLGKAFQALVDQLTVLPDAAGRRAALLAHRRAVIERFQPARIADDWAALLDRLRTRSSSQRDPYGSRQATGSPIERCDGTRSSA